MDVARCSCDEGAYGSERCHGSTGVAGKVSVLECFLFSIKTGKKNDVLIRGSGLTVLYVLISALEQFLPPISM